MPLTRQQKEQIVQEVGDNINAATSVVFVAYDGLTVPDVNELRDKLHASGSRMRVMPKRLLKLVLTNTKLDWDPISQEGQIAVIWGSDTVAPAKVMYEFAKGKETIRLLAGALEKNMLSLEEVTSLAQLPGRQELLAMLVGTLAGPMSGLVRVFSGTQRQVVYVLQAVKDKKIRNT